MFVTKLINAFVLAALPILPVFWLAGAAQPAQADQADVGWLLNQLRFASDDDDREDAAKKLGKIGDPAALPILQQAAVYDNEDDVRDAARDAMLKITGKVPPPLGIMLGPDVCSQLIGQLFNARDDDDRESAAKRLGSLGDLRALPALEQAAVFDREDDVRDAARKAAVNLRRTGGQVREELIYRYDVPPAPSPRFEPAPPPAPAPQCPPPTPPANPGYSDYGAVPNYNTTTINNTYNYTYITNNYYNSNNTYVNPPAVAAPPVVYRPTFVAPPAPVVIERPVFVTRPPMFMAPPCPPIMRYRPQHSDSGFNFTFRFGRTETRGDWRDGRRHD